MKTLERLRLEAKEACDFRGHKMHHFRRDEFYKETIRHSSCKTCGMGVTINSHPAPNEIDIGGEAVALNCT